MIKKYSSVLSSNLIKSIIFFLINILLARSLEVDEYGNIVFIFFLVSSVYTLLDVSSTPAMFSLYSFNRKVEILYVYYFWQGIIFLIVSSFFFLYTFEYYPNYLMHSFLVSIIVFIQQQIYVSLAQISEVQGNTIKFYFKNTVMYLIFISIMAILYVEKKLSLDAYLSLYLFISVIQLFVTIKLMQFKIVRLGWWQVLNDYFNYIKPLILLSFIVFVNNMLSRGMLQVYGGGTQQANYQIALTISNSITIVTASYLNIFWVKLVDLAKTNSTSELNKYMFETLMKSTIFASFVCCTLFPISSETLSYFFGNKYASAGLILKILLFYPITQSFGQIFGVYLLNTNNQKTHSLISIVSILLLAISSYFAIKFSFILKLETSIALAFSLTIINFFSIIMQAFFVDKKSGLNLKYTKFCIASFIFVLFSSLISFLSFLNFRVNYFSNIHFLYIILSWALISISIFYSVHMISKKYIVKWAVG